MGNAELEILAEGFVFLEGPRWHDGKLWVSDMWGHTVYTLTEAGECSVIAEIPERPSGLNFLPDGTLVVVSMADRKLVKVDGEGVLSDYADLSSLVSADINDSIVDGDGNIYVGNFGFDLMNGADPALANLVLVTPEREIRVAASDMNFPNGTVITGNGKTLICAETFGNVLTAFDRAGDGRLTNRRVWADLGERTPDGICLDEEGAIWVACFMSGEFIRVMEGGDVSHRIEVPGKRAVACNLGGADGRTLFALTYEGEIEEVASGAKNARVETCRVEVPGAGSP
ncbi:MAG: SMP-30/gluconolactonase/LRE family protein [Gammaproteobacteria bacterium]|nr:SMP-30/gluconolactonase/LRE family protein [Gammaproteobacteria bacterium]